MTDSRYSLISDDDFEKLEDAEFNIIHAIKAIEDCTTAPHLVHHARSLRFIATYLGEALTADARKDAEIGDELQRLLDPIQPETDNGTT
jgi:hypothetical protein